ncbi:MAG: two-component system sensor histidine kinase ChvG [Flavobacteriales bacterium]|jgi:two-component system sensor histidine kinase ChvG
MRLRKQLFLVSLITLCLPWVGCQYIQELESSLQKGQADALEASALAIAARIGSDSSTRQALENNFSDTPSEAVYTHRFKAAPILDGYSEEWGAQGITPQPLPQYAGFSSNTSLTARLKVAEYANDLYVFLDVPDNAIRYHNPRSSSALADNVRLNLVSNTMRKRQYRLFASAPGELSNVLLSDSANTSNMSTRQTAASIPKEEHLIQGRWVESQHGYWLELKFPRHWADKGIGIYVYDAQQGVRQAMIRWSNIQADSTNTAGTLIRTSSILENSLKVFRREGLKLSLASREGALIASTGDLSSHADSDAQLPWIFNSLYKLSTKAITHPDYIDTTSEGFYKSKDIVSTLKGITSRAGFQENSRVISRVSVPVYGPVYSSAHNSTTKRQPTAKASSLHASKQTQQTHQQAQQQTPQVPLQANPLVLDDSAAYGAVYGAVIVEQNAENLSSFTSSAFSKLMLYSFAVSFMAALLLVLYASWLSLRIRKLNRAASNAISDSGKINNDFCVSRHPDEIGELSRSFAKLLARLHEYTGYLRTLSSKLSHELRTPLAIVSSSLDNLEHEHMSEQGKVYAARAKDGAARLSSILNAMGAASRVEQAIDSAEVEEIPFDEVLNHLKDAYSDVYTQAQFALNIKAHPAGFTILAAGDLIVQMLDKLVDNAAEFAPLGGHIELGLTRNDSELIVSVYNQGPPLPETMHKQLFDSMVSIRESGATQPSGQPPGQPPLQHLGLGLYIVRLIVDFHRGHVSARNHSNGEGVCFEIRLPLTNSQ